MPDKRYDAVIVGGGHHATIIACYLQKAGLKTAIFERWHEIGGGACGEELPLPGFIQNPCAHWTRFYANPAYKDFNLREYGLVYIFPEYNEGWIMPDGRYILGKAIFEVIDPKTGQSAFNSERAQDLVDQIRKINEDDARTVEDIIERYRERWRKAYATYRFTGPDEWGEEDPLEELCHDPKYGIDPKIKDMTVGQIATSLFKSRELQAFYMRAMTTSTGFFHQDKPGIYWHIHNLGLMLSFESAAVVIGGTHSITHALLRAFEDLGGEFFVLSEVEKVLVKNGAAKGIRLKDGTEIEADIVVSDLNIELSLWLLGEEHVPKDLWIKAQKLREKPQRIEDDPGYERTHVFWGNIAFFEPVRYPQNPNLGYVPRLYMGDPDPEYFLSGKFQRDRWEKGIGDKLYIIVSPDSQWDKTRAPQGRFTAIVEEFTCPWHIFPERQWLRLKREIVPRIIKEWGKYAENVNMDNFIEAWISTPDDVLNRNPCMPTGGWGGLNADVTRSGRLRPFPEVSNYRLPVKNYYLCSSAAHCGHGIGRGNSYNCYKAIAKDFNLSYRPWEGREL